MTLDYDSLDPYLEPLMAAVRRAERFLGPEDDWVEDDRRILYEAAQRHLGQYHDFLREKGPADYFTTAEANSDTVEVALYEAGYRRNLASTRKYREHHDGGHQYAVGSFVKPAPAHEDGLERQHHVYLFESPDGGTDLYGHEETSVVEGAEHLTETQQEHGDPLGTARDALDAAALPYGERNL